MKKLMIKIFLFFICLSFCSIANAKELKIVQISDINFATQTDSGQVIEKKLLKFIKKMNNSDTDLVLLTGDNIANSQKDELKSLCNILKNLNKPYYIALGENDVHKVDGIAKADYMRYLNYCNPYQKTDASNYVVKPAKNLAIIILDGAPPLVKSSHGYFHPDALKWLDKTLDKNKKNKVVIFQHFPIIPPEENYPLETLEAQRYNEVIAKHKNILFIASGHFDKNSKITGEKNIEHISTPAFDKAPFCYRQFVINIDSNNDVNYTTSLTEL